jgi:hypothetical protein
METSPDIFLFTTGTILFKTGVYFMNLTDLFSLKGKTALGTDGGLLAK